MDGFKDSTKMKYMGGGGMVDGYAKGGSTKPAMAKPMMKGGDAKPMMKGGDAKPMMKGGDAKPMMKGGAMMDKPMVKKAMGGAMMDGYAKGGDAKVGAKIAKVMGEFKKGDLRNGSKDGSKVSSPKQAMAIALSEAGKGKAPVKKAVGGKVNKTSPIGQMAAPKNTASAAYQNFGRELKGMIDSGMLTIEQANSLKDPVFQAVRQGTVGQQQEAMPAVLAAARGRMKSILPGPITAPTMLSPIFEPATLPVSDRNMTIGLRGRMKQMPQIQMQPQPLEQEPLLRQLRGRGNTDPRFDDFGRSRQFINTMPLFDLPSSDPVMVYSPKTGGMVPLRGSGNTDPRMMKGGLAAMPKKGKR